jgi:glycosyltransferase involved in cell wall biosynthesis
VRILICSNRYFVSGGPERYLFAISEVLEDKGHTVIPFAMDLARNEPTPYAKYFVPHPVDRNAVYFGEMRLNRREKLRLLVATLYSFEARRRARAIIRAEKIDLVYALQIGNYLSPALVDGAHSLGVPIVSRQSDFHLLCPSYHFLRDGHPCEECRHGLWHAIKYRCMKGSLSVSAGRVLGMYLEHALGTDGKINAFVTPTVFLRNKLVEFGYAPEKVVHIPTPIVADHIEPRYGAGEYLLYTGNLNRHKGVRYLVEAMALHPQLTLKIAGSASEDGRDEELRSIIETRALRNVEMVGFKTGSDLAGLYRGATAVVAPTLWYENMPHSVLEAMAYGKPIIASNIGSMPELVEDGVNGFLVPPGDVSALAAKIGDLLSSTQRIAQMGQASRRRVLEHHSVESHYARLNTLFLSCLSPR